MWEMSIWFYCEDLSSPFQTQPEVTGWGGRVWVVEERNLSTGSWESCPGRLLASQEMQAVMDHKVPN